MAVLQLLGGDAARTAAAHHGAGHHGAASPSAAEASVVCLLLLFMLVGAEIGAGGLGLTANKHTNTETERGVG